MGDGAVANLLCRGGPPQDMESMRLRRAFLSLALMAVCGSLSGGSEELAALAIMGVYPALPVYDPTQKWATQEFFAEWRCHFDRLGQLRFSASMLQIVLSCC